MTVRILVVAADDCSTYRERWHRLGIRDVETSFEGVHGLIEGPATPETVFDAVFICCVNVPAEYWETSTVGTTGDALWLAEHIRRLRPDVAMFDGKRWRSIPVLIGAPKSNLAQARVALQVHGYLRHSDVEIVGLVDSDHYGSERIKELVEDYRFQALAEFDEMGFIIREERGRFMVGPALKPREEIAGRYYFGPADKRPRGFTTVHKSNLGIQLEVETFEALINREDVSERQLQVFFEDNPHFLSSMHVPLPHVQLKKRSGEILIPDFILKPIVAQQRDSRWEVLELKLPQVGLLSGRGSRAQLSHRVLRAITQLREYKDHFENADAAEIESILGHPLRRPKLGVLIGRLANTDVNALENAQRHLTDVKIVTYDEILDEQKAQLL